MKRPCGRRGHGTYQNQPEVNGAGAQRKWAVVEVTLEMGIGTMQRMWLQATGYEPTEKVRLEVRMGKGAVAVGIFWRNQKEMELQLPLGSSTWVFQSCFQHIKT